ncbi:hypothetical protein AAG906_025926 [Vitis piasezkii]
MERDKFTLTCDRGCKMGAFTTTQLEGHGWCVLHTNKDADGFYEIAIRFHSEYILRPLLKKRVKGETLCFYEEFNDTLYGWLHNNSNRIITHSGHPSKEFLQVARRRCSLTSIPHILGPSESFLSVVTSEIILAKMHRWTDRRDWTQYVPNEGRFVDILRKTKTVSDDVQTFLRYDRNVVAHANQGIAKRRKLALQTRLNTWIEDTVEEVVARLDMIWSGFINSIHRIYSKHDITIPVDDQ